MAPSRFMLSSSAGPVLRGHDGILVDIRLSERPKAAYLSYSHLFLKSHNHSQISRNNIRHFHRNLSQK